MSGRYKKSEVMSEYILWRKQHPDLAYYVYVKKDKTVSKETKNREISEAHRKTIMDVEGDSQLL